VPLDLVNIIVIAPQVRLVAGALMSSTPLRYVPVNGTAEI
jgi:hypothetical protein